jgi:hypothetical protein
LNPPIDFIFIEFFIWFFGLADLFLQLFSVIAGPLRRTLAKKCIHAFAEIPTLVAHQKKILVFDFGLHAMQRLIWWHALSKACG